MPPSTAIQFGVYEVDLATGELHKDGVRLRIQDQPLKVLRVLLERPGELVTREELKQVLAPDSPFGDFDHAINVAVAKLRTALNDSAERPVYIETLHKRGYRFVAPLTRAPDVAVIEPKPALVAPYPTAAVRRRPTPKWGLIAGLGVLFVGLAAFFLLRPQNLPVYQPTAFTAMQGMTTYPAFSPDGNEIAFTWQRDDPKNARVFVQALGSVVARQLIDDPEPNHLERAPHWFPDGRNLAYIRQANGLEEIWIVSRTGGSPRKIVGGFGRLQNFDIAPDAKSVVMAAQQGEEAPSLYLVSLENLEARRLTSPENKPWSVAADRTWGDNGPRFSPDGGSVAFVRFQATGADLLRIAVEGGEPERLTDDSTTIAVGAAAGGFTWGHDGKSLLVIAWRPASSSTRAWWRVWLDGRRWDSLPLTGRTDTMPVLSNDGRRLAFVQNASFVNIWRYDLSTGQTRAEAVNLTRSVSTDLGAKYSPDGGRLAFASLRSGHFEIYVASSDGSNPVQLTSFRGKDAGSPAWSPDGKQIVFDYRPDAHAHVFAIDSTGGPARQLTFGDSDDVVPFYSRDGQWVYFARLREGGSDLWKVASAGGTPMLVAADGFHAEESSDGTYLNYTKLTDKKIALYARSPGGGEERRLFQDSDDTMGGKSFFVAVKDGIYYARQQANTAANQLMFYHFATRRSEPLLDLPLGGWRPSVSPDGRYVLISKFELQSNIMLVDNFR